VQRRGEFSNVASQRLGLGGAPFVVAQRHPDAESRDGEDDEGGDNGHAPDNGAAQHERDGGGGQQVAGPVGWLKAEALTGWDTEDDKG